MAKRISERPVVDRNEYAKQMVFLDSQGYVCVADRPQPLSEEEKAKRQKERAKGEEARKRQRAAYRKKVQDARKRLLKEKSVAAAEALEQAEAEYNGVMGR